MELKKRRLTGDYSHRRTYKRSLLFGIGINDASYVTQKYEYIDGRTPSGIRKRKSVWKCPYYVKWKSMIERCYSTKYLETRPTYRGCTVCEEWLLFSNFREWMLTQDWEGNQLDKDLLFLGNKIYSPETCCFISGTINSFLLGGKISNTMVGVTSPKGMDYYLAHCGANPSSGRENYIGLYPSEVEAHLAWKKRKHEYACQLVDSENVTDSRVVEALRNRYKNYTTVEDHIK